jgi:ribose 5-phosphate isomerase A
MTQDEAKLLVAKRAAELVRDGQAVGLGTGTTATLFIRELAKRKLKVRCVASSRASAKLAKELGMKVHRLSTIPKLDVYIDGADEIALRAGCGHGPGCGLDLIKGGGGALLREKIVASAAKEFIVVADSTKIVEKLGRFPLPVEIIQMALPLVEPKLKALGLNPKLRMKNTVSQGLKPAVLSACGDAGTEVPAYPKAKAPSGADGEPFVTDEGNYILDCACGRIEEPEETAAELKNIVGVVEHGLFLGYATLALVAGESGVAEYRA